MSLLSPRLDAIAKLKIPVCICPIPPLCTGCGTRSIFKWSITGLNSEFSFSQTSCQSKVKEPSLYLPNPYIMNRMLHKRLKFSTILHYVSFLKSISISNAWCSPFHVLGCHFWKSILVSNAQSSRFQVMIASEMAWLLPFESRTHCNVTERLMVGLSCKENERLISEEGEIKELNKLKKLTESLWNG